ncbi:AAA family ATPase [Saccharibacter sp. 17.LH.SD]|uniref:AAA family ATPase n=1 Tax=Saccharibacter sp. 17.LH.SD TaxID=2689393 RepID=UPI001F26C1DE|nr:AAA family ATPase [Saccharibacter sp. 17.LH.SD]
MTMEAEALANILKWSVDSPGWQRDALRRLVEQEILDQTKIDELVSICKGDSLAVPLNEGHLRNPNLDPRAVNLRQVSGVRHVNALAQDQRLTFSRDGLTVIYGDNGSGKSGYARILKKVCRARMAGRIEEIVPDVYEVEPGGVPSATIEYVIGGQKRNCVWELGHTADTALSSISVFDSRTANVHVDAENDVAYTPFPLKLLGELSQLCASVKNKLAEEIAHIKKQTPEAIKVPAFSRDTAVSRLMNQLAADTEPETVEALAALTQLEQDRLLQLTEDLAGDPVRKMRQLDGVKAKVEKYIIRLDQLFSSISDENTKKLHCYAIDSDVARRAAEAASSKLFRIEPLPHIGSEIWRALWESARAFSDTEAYPKRCFPVTDSGSVCVLCQQELTPVAVDRLNRFEAFIRNDSQARAEAARLAYDRELATFKEKAISLGELTDIIETIRNELGLDGLALEFRSAIVSALWRHRQVRLRHVNQIVSIDVTVAKYPRQALVEQVKDIQKRMDALVVDASSPVRNALIAEKAELADRQFLGGIKADVLKEIERRKQIALLEVAQRDTATNRITLKSTELARTLVTDTLRARFAHEVASFGIADLAVELRQGRSSHGSPRFKVSLIRKPDASVGQVLSEGEYRCVALAAFMAELATAENKSGIVFDDPVSSLDHMHREAVAKRLVAEAAHRQVIVFTHDLAFLFELNQAAGKQSVLIGSISRGADKVGFCRNESPFKARRVNEIVVKLKKQVENKRYHFETGNLDEWRKSVKYIAATLRDTWEIAVEEVVSYVIQRLSNKVKTPGLVKLTVITVADCKVMRSGFDCCSELLHSAAPELNRPLPKPEILIAEIDKLGRWVAIFNSVRMLRSYHKCSMCYLNTL